MNENQKSPLRLHTMFGRKHIDLAIRCLGSMAHYYDQPLHVIAHEDGSTTPEDEQRFRDAIPSSEFVFKRDADPIVNQFLSKYPACRRLRDNLVFGLKIFDIQILEQGPELSYADCDIIFVRPISRLFRMPDDPKAGGVFMRDPRQAYCLTWTQFATNRKLRLADRLNGGLLHFRRSAFDWDLVEWFLSHNQYTIHPYWKEQTAWSVLAAATQSWHWSERNVRVITRPSDLNAKVAVAHYVSSYRSLLDLAPVKGNEDLKPIEVEMLPLGLCTHLKFAVDPWRRYLSRTKTSVLNGLVKQPQSSVNY